MKTTVKQVLPSFSESFPIKLFCGRMPGEPVCKFIWMDSAWVWCSSNALNSQKWDDSCSVLFLTPLPNCFSLLVEKLPLSLLSGFCCFPACVCVYVLGKLSRSVAWGHGVLELGLIKPSRDVLCRPKTTTVRWNEAFFFGCTLTKGMSRTGFILES